MTLPRIAGGIVAAAALVTFAPVQAEASILDRAILYNHTGGNLYVQASPGQTATWSNGRRENIHWHNPSGKIRIWASGNCQTMVYHYRGGLAQDVISRIGQGGTYVTIRKGYGKTIQRWCR